MRRRDWILVAGAAVVGAAAPGTAAPVCGQQIADELRRPLRVQRDLPFRELDGETVAADLYRPDDQGVYPLVLMIHGGAWTSGDKWNLADHARELAQAGFVALAINYRLAPRYPITEQISDCRVALRWAQQQADQWLADANRLCVWGYSAGGQLAAWLATAPQPGQPAICAVVAGGAPCDFDFVPADSRSLAHVMGGTRQEVPHAYAEASPLTHASPAAPPFFFFHGTHDLLVPASSSRKLYDRLRQLQVPAEYHVVENKGHLLTFLDPTARRRAIDFLRQSTSKESD